MTGGVHGYETSGVHGALRLLQTKCKDYAAADIVHPDRLALGLRTWRKGGIMMLWILIDHSVEPIRTRAARRKLERQPVRNAAVAAGPAR